MSEPRQVLAEADRHQATANAAESARVKIRLSEAPVMRRGLLGFRKHQPTDRELVFNAAETRAIYEALAAVRDEHRKHAERLEATLRVEAAEQ